MKKRSIWILLISALLGLSMLLAACGSGGTTADPSDSVSAPEDTGTPPADEAMDFSSLIAQWQTYITPVQKAPAARNNYTAVVEEADLSEYSSLGSFYYRQEINTELTDDGPVDRTDTYIYDGNLRLIRQLVDRNYNTETGDWDIQYSITRTLCDGRVLEIQTTTYAVIDTIPTTTVEYNYYDAEGEAIGRASEVQGINHPHCFVLGDQSYHINDEGKVFYTAHATENYEHVDTYDFTYRTSAGDEYGYLIDGDRLLVFNSDYVVVAECSIATAGYEILDNGDIYLYETVSLGERATRFDYEDPSGDKYDVRHTVVSLATGEATELDLPFIISAMYTNLEADITGIQLKADCQYAEITRIVDGALSLTAEFVILDNTLSEVAALPFILEDQTSLIGSENENRMIIAVARPNTVSAQYVVDMTDGSVERYNPPANAVGYGIDGGYIHQNAVYTTAGAKVLDLTEADHSALFNNICYTVKGAYIDYTDYSEEKKNDITAIGFFDEYGQFGTRVIATSQTQELDGIYLTTTQQNVVSAISDFIMVIETIETLNTEDDTVESTINYILYNRNGEEIQRFIDCLDATILPGTTPRIEVTPATGTTTIYLIQ